MTASRTPDGLLRTFLGHGSNAILAVLLAASLAAGRPLHGGLALLGAVIFLSGEYGFHRFVLHAPPMPAIPLLGRLQHRLHLHHHAEPSRIDLLFMPPWFLLPSLASTALLAWSIWPSPDRVASFLAGILAATLHYEWSHYVAHVPYRPRTPWGRRLKRRHLRHHFVDERTWFGVTHSLADLALGTHDRAEPIPRSATLQTLRRR